MNAILTSLVNTCEHLLLLLTGPHALTSPDRKEAAEEAISVLTDLEGALKVSHASAAASMMRSIASVKHPTEVRYYLADVIRTLQTNGIAI